MSDLLRLTHVTKRYRRSSTELRVLDRVSLDVQSGEVVCVLAMRGQGKTTLLRIAAGMESPDGGEVRFEGSDLAALSDSELSQLLGRRIAWAGGEGPGMAMRMLDYVAMPLLVSPRRWGRRHRAAEHDAYERARGALERVGAPDTAEQQWADCSDWERALVEIAQGIVGEPALLLIDDLTDTLGIRETDELTALVRELARERGLGVLMGVSDGQATLWSDRIVTLAGGALTDGPRAQGANVIEFPDAGSGRRGLERGSI
jgi:ABC-type cobalamin/Fe3+-siderophores transport system ATPase subunit